MKFYKKTKKIENKPSKHWRRRIVLWLVFLFVIGGFMSFFAYLLNEYYQTHTFKTQTPVIIRTPIIIERVTIESPLSTHSALPIAYAEEVINPYDEGSPRHIGWDLIKEKWGLNQWGYFDELVMRESSWNPYSVNSSSGACYLPQALPCAKLNAEPWEVQKQLEWMIDYIDDRYNTPKEALSFHDANGWY